MSSAVVGELSVDKRETYFTVAVAVGQSELHLFGAVRNDIIEFFITGFSLKQIVESGG